MLSVCRSDGATAETLSFNVLYGGCRGRRRVFFAPSQSPSTNALAAAKPAASCARAYAESSGRPWGLLPAPLRSCWGAGARSRRRWVVARLRRPPACPWRGAKRGAAPGSCGTSYKRFNIAPNSPNLKWRPFASRQWCRASGDGKRPVWVAGTTSSVGMDTIWWSLPWDPLPLAEFETARRRGGEASAGPCCSLGKMYLLGRRLEESCTLLGPGSPVGRTGSWGGCYSVYLLFNLDAAFLFIKTVLKHRCPLLRIYALKVVVVGIHRVRASGNLCTSTSPLTCRAHGETSVRSELLGAKPSDHWGFAANSLQLTDKYVLVRMFLVL